MTENMGILWRNGMTVFKTDINIFLLIVL